MTNKLAQKCFQKNIRALESRMSALLAQVLSVRQIISRRHDSSRNEFMTVLTKKYPSNFMRLVYFTSKLDHWRITSFKTAIAKKDWTSLHMEIWKNLWISSWNGKISTDEENLHLKTGPTSKWKRGPTPQIFKFFHRYICHVKLELAKLSTLPLPGYAAPFFKTIHQSRCQNE